MPVLQKLSPGGLVGLADVAAKSSQSPLAVFTRIWNIWGISQDYWLPGVLLQGVSHPSLIWLQTGLGFQVMTCERTTFSGTLVQLFLGKSSSSSSQGLATAQQFFIARVFTGVGQACLQPQGASTPLLPQFCEPPNELPRIKLPPNMVCLLLLPQGPV